MRTLFTPAQANKTLPLVKRIVADILDKGRLLRELASHRQEDEALKRIERLEGELRDLISFGSDREP